MPCWGGMFVACRSQFQFICSSFVDMRIAWQYIGLGSWLKSHLRVEVASWLSWLAPGARHTKHIFYSNLVIWCLYKIIHYCRFTSAPARFFHGWPSSIVLQTAKLCGALTSSIGWVGYVHFGTACSCCCWSVVCALELACWCRCRVPLQGAASGCRFRVLRAACALYHRIMYHAFSVASNSLELENVKGSPWKSYRTLKESKPKLQNARKIQLYSAWYVGSSWRSHHWHSTQNQFKICRRKNNTEEKPENLNKRQEKWKMLGN